MHDSEVPPTQCSAPSNFLDRELISRLSRLTPNIKLKFLFLGSWPQPVQQPNDPENSDASNH
jgi:hypothetical protein